ncbi:TM0106 family RecB-like putative nuclease [Corynebacterium aquatimens]|uniref:RecB family nuclease n=1 Tax=Corynebacterium aquatimens TaxID=1190508 RepID=A0A931E213_9CORY|nr:TM0106 family RecB-like putative nuclease [Corynebacterium aquatimens]MBG6122813.1 putative RecB family nuclease [Corynebacterium aquatimens]WJY66852.1 hypothetical protein CAQUA_10830 [Corynebacterium aquatimens]
MARTQFVRAGDLVGCRYRLRQRLAHPDVPPLPDAIARQPRINAARAAVFDALPVRRALGDGRSKRFTRVDLDPALEQGELEIQTAAAMKRRANLITNAVLTGEIDGVAVVAEIDILVRRVDGTYLPVMVSNHRVARAHPRATMRYIPTARLGLGAPLEVGAKLRHRTLDGYRVAMAELLLRERGLASGEAAVIGQDRERAYIGDVDRYVLALRTALAQHTPTQPRRLKQCASCRFWALCEPELRAMDDISLVYPGERARALRDRGLNTVEAVIDQRLGEPSEVAAAWRAGIPVLARQQARSMARDFPRADVEIDVDMEAYLDQGAYLWGAFDGTSYHGFATWDDVGGASEEANFVEFWTWLMGRREAALREGKTFRAYCYAAGGENHWMTTSARRFSAIDAGEVSSFIASDEWVDVFPWVNRMLVGTEGLGLKIVGPTAGFTWSDDDVDGERSVALRLTARGNGPDALAARDMLLRYNEDDCRATSAVRAFLRAGAPGIPVLGHVLPELPSDQSDQSYQ